MKLDTIIRTKLLGQPYRPSQRRFENDKIAGLRCASIVVDYVLEILPVKSVIDIGCGPALWLKTFADRGASRIVGIDGDYTDRTRLAIDPTCFIGRDLNQRLTDLNLGKFDLAMSLEVGEHLLPERAESLVDDLCALSDFVMYGAAIEKQGGDQHINEHWQSWWVAKFRSRDYLPYDVLRPAIWDRSEIASWYKQNTIFYVRCGSSAHDIFAKRFPSPPTVMFDLVHPDLFLSHRNTKTGLRRLRKNVKRIFRPITGR